MIPARRLGLRCPSFFREMFMTNLRTWAQVCSYSMVAGGLEVMS